ncbi:carbonic anhydrase family protein [Anabaena cylindrica FACHB-243]|nr:carbonic anhydrase family protein [Anabaena cylindrica FACHB-243]MBY5282399.1 carbonic anhydrase family protein [Anabaena sp. CCAP 1446/1C]MBY5306325.1 carbonic anhydrase family protein [Anabaena sp. CCAP 1446/1C]
MVFDLLSESRFARFKRVKIKNLLFIIFLILFTAVFSPQVLAEEKAPHWSYGGAANPTKWSQISTEFAMCELGRDQSPINIDDAVQGTPINIEFNYKPTPLSVVNNGHTVQVNYKSGSTININGEKYELLQFHFHTPSEHTISGKASALELHLVHRNGKGQLAVVGVMMAKGTTNPLIEQIWKHIPAAGKNNIVQNSTISAANLLPKNKAYFSYTGSLTTPPCSESVKWNVLAEPIQVSEEQIEAFQNLYQVNARPVQPINGRRIEFHG